MSDEAAAAVAVVEEAAVAVAVESPAPEPPAEVVAEPVVEAPVTPPPAVVEEPPLVAELVASIVEEAAAVVVEEIVEATAPVVEEVASSVVAAVEEVATVVEEAAAVVEDIAAVILPVVEEVASVVEEVASVIEEVAPAPEPTPEPTPVVVEEVAAPVEVPAPVAEVAPVVEVAPPTPEPILDFSGAPSLVAVVESEGVTAAAVEPPTIVEEVKKMAPPKYADLGKAARDLFTTSFPLGSVKLESNTSSDQGIQFSAQGSHNTHSGATVAALETKFKYEPYGLSFTKRWDTSNLISSKIGLESSLLKGLKVDLDTTLDPIVGKKTALVKASYQHGDVIHATTDVDFGNLSAPTIHGTVVAAYKGWLAGYHASYDTADKRLVNNNFSVAYKDGDVEMNGSVVNGKNYSGAVHHQVSNKLGTAAMLNYVTGGSATSFAICGSYAVEDNVTVKAKVDSNLSLGLSYVHKHSSGLELTLAGNIDGKSLEKGGHKLGVSLTFDA